MEFYRCFADLLHLFLNRVNNCKITGKRMQIYKKAVMLLMYISGASAAWIFFTAHVL